MRPLNRAQRRLRLLLHTLCAWLVIEGTIGIAAGFATSRHWIGDPDMKGVGETIAFFTVFLAPGMLLVSFALIMPGTMAIQALSRGNWPRPLNVMVGAFLVAPVAWLLSARDGRVDWLGVTLTVALALAGMIVGAGAQSRGEVLID